MIKNSFQNYNIFLISIFLILISFLFSKITKVILYLISIILLTIFVYYQFKLFKIDSFSDYQKNKIIITNYIFALLSIYLIINLIYYIFY